MKRVKLVLYIFILAGMKLSAQAPLHTQYMLNPFLINPALAGTFNYYQIRTSHRFQWVSLTDAPITNFLSAFGPHAKKDQNMGWGGSVYSDVTGPTSRTGINGSYGYNVAVNEDIRLSMGASLGLVQSKVDFTKINFAEVDPLAEESVMTSYAPDAAIGFFLYSSNFNVGLSSTQLLGGIVEPKNQFVKLKSTFYLSGAYTHILTRDYAIEPSAVIKSIANPMNLQFDINARVLHRKYGWAGISYRYNDALSIMIGYTHEKKFEVGYSFDLGLTAIKKYSSGTHELMIAYKFTPLK